MAAELHRQIPGAEHALHRILARKALVQSRSLPVVPQAQVLRLYHPVVRGSGAGNLRTKTLRYPVSAVHELVVLHAQRAQRQGTGQAEQVHDFPSLRLEAVAHYLHLGALGCRLDGEEVQLVAVHSCRLTSALRSVLIAAQLQFVAAEHPTAHQCVAARHSGAHEHAVGHVHHIVAHRERVERPRAHHVVEHRAQHFLPQHLVLRLLRHLVPRHALVGGHQRIAVLLHMLLAQLAHILQVRLVAVALIQAAQLPRVRRLVGAVFRIVVPSHSHALRLHVSEQLRAHLEEQHVAHHIPAVLQLVAAQVAVVRVRGGDDVLYQVVVEEHRVALIEERAGIRRGKRLLHLSDAAERVPRHHQRTAARRPVVGRVGVVVGADVQRQRAHLVEQVAPDAEHLRHLHASHLHRHLVAHHRAVVHDEAAHAVVLHRRIASAHQHAVLKVIAREHRREVDRRAVLLVEHVAFILLRRGDEVAHHAHVLGRAAGILAEHHLAVGVGHVELRAPLIVAECRRLRGAARAGLPRRIHIQHVRVGPRGGRETIAGVNAGVVGQAVKLYHVRLVEAARYTVGHALVHRVHMPHVLAGSAYEPRHVGMVASAGGRRARLHRAAVHLHAFHQAAPRVHIYHRIVLQVVQHHVLHHDATAGLHAEQVTGRRQSAALYAQRAPEHHSIVQQDITGGPCLYPQIHIIHAVQNQVPPARRHHAQHVGVVGAHLRTRHARGKGTVLYHPDVARVHP